MCFWGIMGVGKRMMIELVSDLDEMIRDEKDDVADGMRKAGLKRLNDFPEYRRMGIAGAIVRYA